MTGQGGGAGGRETAGGKWAGLLLKLQGCVVLRAVRESGRCRGAAIARRNLYILMHITRRTDKVHEGHPRSLA